MTGGKRKEIEVVLFTSLFQSFSFFQFDFNNLTDPFSLYLV